MLGAENSTSGHLAKPRISQSIFNIFEELSARLFTSFLENT
jgi:hypothetical protein